jgi:hypothetical protein
MEGTGELCWLHNCKYAGFELTLGGKKTECIYPGCDTIRPESQKGKPKEKKDDTG